MSSDGCSCRRSDSWRPLAVPTLSRCGLCPMIHRTVAVVVDGLAATTPRLRVQASRERVDGIVYRTHRSLCALDGPRRDLAPHSARNEHPRKQSHVAKGTRFDSCGRRFGKGNLGAAVMDAAARAVLDCP